MMRSSADEGAKCQILRQWGVTVVSEIQYSLKLVNTSNLGPDPVSYC